MKEGEGRNSGAKEDHCTTTTWRAWEERGEARPYGRRGRRLINSNVASGGGSGNPAAHLPYLTFTARYTGRHYSGEKNKQFGGNAPRTSCSYRTPGDMAAGITSSWRHWAILRRFCCGRRGAQRSRLCRRVRRRCAVNLTLTAPPRVTNVSGEDGGGAEGAEG